MVLAFKKIKFFIQPRSYTHTLRNNNTISLHTISSVIRNLLPLQELKNAFNVQWPLDQRDFFFCFLIFLQFHRFVVHRPKPNPSNGCTAAQLKCETVCAQNPPNSKNRHPPKMGSQLTKPAANTRHVQVFFPPIHINASPCQLAQNPGGRSSFPINTLRVISNPTPC